MANLDLLSSQFSYITGWIDVTWDHGGSNSYRMGAEGKYDLKLASDPETTNKPASPSGKYC